ncbi:MAG TPA: 3-hydroxyacyl-CoA dehydrogenase family protein [Gemmatimonadales bacterium]|nr:3-hydroxyacyl-CoA dehydrogenase family protein [Gemmatimonadales bacterium]
MTRFETPRVAIVGAGEIGRGWAALAVAAGWPVTIYDADAEVLNPAADAIGDRVVALVRLKRAEAMVAEEALSQMRIGRSLLQAVSEANWIIEAVHEDLPTKLKALQQSEKVARQAAIITSSSSGLGPSILSSRLERPDRFMVAHPLDPVELIPLVEVVPSPHTDPACVEDVRFWLSLLGRAPIVFKKEVPGNITARLTAALWRECIQLVVDGVLDVEDVDRAVSVGPALGWVAAGPHLEQHLAAGEWGVDVFVAKMLGTYEEIWKGLADWKQLGPEDQKRLIRLVDRAYSRHTTELREARDQRLVRLLAALRE